MPVTHYCGPLGDLYAEVHKPGASSPPDTQAHPQHEPELTQRENVYRPEPAPRDRSGLALALSGGRLGGLPQRQTPERIYEEISQFSVHASLAPAQEAQPQGHESPSRLVRKNALSLGKKGVGKGASAKAAVAAVAAARATTKRAPPADDSKPTPPPRSRSQAPTHMAPNPQQNALTDALTKELKAVLSERAACATGAVTARVTRGNEVIA